MTIQFTKAERRKSKLRLAIAGASGAGKTYSSLKLAKGLGGKVCLIDTERGSGDLYAHLLDYDVAYLEKPYKPEKYVEAINAAEEAGYDIIIIDSLSHAWADDGGLLDQADKLQGRGGNRFTVWAELSQQHRRLVNALLESRSHIIGTMRSKQSYAMEQDEKTGKTNVKKHGMAPVQRDGMEYEFTVFMDIDQNHNATVTKDRTDLFQDEVFRIDEGVGQRIMKWLNEGVDDPKAQKQEVMRELRRLKIDVPKDPADAREFMAGAMPRLTELEWKEENLGDIIAALKELTDSARANELAWGQAETPTRLREETPQQELKPDPEAPKKTPGQDSTGPGYLNQEGSTTTSNKQPSDHGEQHDTKDQEQGGGADLPSH